MQKTKLSTLRLVFQVQLLNKITPLLCVKKNCRTTFSFLKKKISHTIHLFKFLWRYLLKTNLKAAALFCWFYLLRVFTLLLLLGNKKQPILCQNIPPPKKITLFLLLPLQPQTIVEKKFTPKFNKLLKQICLQHRILLFPPWNYVLLKKFSARSAACQNVWRALEKKKNYYSDLKSLENWNVSCAN